MRNHTEREERSNHHYTTVRTCATPVKKLLECGVNGKIKFIIVIQGSLSLRLSYIRINSITVTKREESVESQFVHVFSHPVILRLNS